MPPMDLSSFGQSGISIPSAQDLADVNFTHTYIPGTHLPEQQILYNR